MSPRGGARTRLEQATTSVELALILPVFLMLLLGIADFGRAIFLHNAVSEAAREGARRAIVLVSLDEAGASPAATLKTVTGTDATAIRDAAVNHTDAFTDGLIVTASTAVEPTNGAYIQVRVTATYRPVAGALLGGIGNLPLGATSKMYLP